MRVKKRFKLALQRAREGDHTPARLRVHADTRDEYIDDLWANIRANREDLELEEMRRKPSSYTAILICNDSRLDPGTVVVDSTKSEACVAITNEEFKALGEFHAIADPVDEVTEEIDRAWATHLKEEEENGRKHDGPHPWRLDPELSHAKGFQAGSLYGSGRVLAELGEMVDTFSEPILRGLSLLKAAAVNGPNAIKKMGGPFLVRGGPLSPKSKERIERYIREHVKGKAMQVIPTTEPPPATETAPGERSVEDLRGEICALVGRACDLVMEMPERNDEPSGRELHAAEEILFALRMDIGDNGIDDPIAVIADALARVRKEAE